MRFSIICFSLLVFCTSAQLRASHNSGGDLTYKWIGGNDYIFTATLFGDCGGASPPNTLALLMRSDLCGIDSTKYLPADTFVSRNLACNSSPNICNGNSYYKVFKDTITLPGKCKDWRFSVLTGTISNMVTTISFGNRFYTECTLDNVSMPGNNSPYVPNDAFLFVYANKKVELNFRAIDDDGDSLSYEMLTPLDDSITYYTYSGGYTGRFPFGVTQNTVFDSTMGKLTVNTGGPLGTYFRIRVNEYRNGQKIGYIDRHVMVVVVNNQANSIPTLSGINGTNSYSYKVCNGDTLDVQIFTNDSDGVYTELRWLNPFNGPSFSTSGTGFKTGRFTWTTDTTDYRSFPYLLFVEVRDTACDMGALQVRVYSIMVDSCKSGSSVGVRAINSNGIFLMPNPTRDDLYVKIDDFGYRMEIRDLKGVLVFSSTLQKGNNKLSVGHLATGTYVVRVLRNGGLLVEKLVIQR